MMDQKPVVIIGAGPAGLTATSELAARGVPVVILEKTDRVGGIARTDEYKGYRFDIGGHRFFTRVPWVMEFWKREMGDDFLRRPRQSHIYYRREFYTYPIKPFEALRKFGLKESVAVIASYLRAQVRRRPNEETFEDYIINHFGERLFNHFFKSYTEKVWGIPTSEIRAAWAAQRIKGMTIWGMLRSALFPSRNKFTSLIDQFYYPRLGPGQMWERVRDRVLASGRATFYFNATVIALTHADGVVQSVKFVTPRGDTHSIDCRAVISSAPLRELLHWFSPALPGATLAAANGLHYRDFLVVALIIDRVDMFPDNWIYIHDRDVRVGRIQNFKNWSPELVPDATKTCLGLEYFLFDTDRLWHMPDHELVNMAAQELVRIGLAKRREIIDGCVVRMPKAYPTYDRDYEQAMPTIREALAQFQNVYPVGRNGMHKYNNQDHAMYTAKLSVENLCDGAQHDIWDVNVERVYHEEVDTRQQTQ